MNKGLALLSGAGMGAALMYLFDPNAGRRRRALARDQVVSAFYQAGNAIEPTAEDLRNRSYGFIADVTGRFTERDVSDRVLVERVRARLGRHVSHPGSIEVSAREGGVTLSGPILAHEVDGLLNAVSSIRSVRSVENRLEVHERPGNVPGLQGGSVPRGGRFELLQENWSPTARLATGAAGGALAIYGAKNLGLFGKLLSGLGLGLFTRALTNLPVKRLVGIDTGRRAVDVQKTINVAAPVERVFEFWSNFENFSRFMEHVREVKDLGHGRSRWTVDGPAGVPLSWEAMVTKRVNNEVLAWRSQEGAAVPNAGTVHFTPNAKGGTQIHINLSYTPPGGAAGHGVAMFFGSDPETSMDEDLMRFKSLFERGKTTADGETVTVEQVEDR